MTLPFALLLDAILGEPDWLWRRLPHPAVLLGKLVGALDERLNTGTMRRARGVLAVVIFIMTAGAIGLVIAALPFGPVFEIIAAAILLAQRSLADHVTAVADGLDAGLADGRSAVAHIVGRDTAALDESGVARAAIESAAENFSDGIVAPAFWFLIAGLPGMLIYKAINTADSMIGYRTDRHREFGWAAAHLDDLVNLPASRLSAVLLAIGPGMARALTVTWRDAALHRSPNAGWPEAAMAAQLGIALAGPRVYQGAATDDPFVHAEGRKDINASDVRAAVRRLWTGWGCLLALTVAIAAL